MNSVQSLLISSSTLLLLSGCSCLAPSTVRVEADHLSHASQHFGAHPTNIGAEYAAVHAQWQRGGAYLDIGEGYNVSPADGHLCIGGLCGPRELTTVSVGYEWRIRP